MVLALSAAITCGAPIVESEIVDSTDVLEAVAVTASNVPATLGATARIVTLLDSVKIASLPAQNVNDLLKYVAGVDVRQRGPEGAQTDISMRGGTFDQIAVLINGINISDPQTGHNSVDFPVDLSDIERIEVLEGPAARVYGAQSLVGAINIVTKKPSNDVNLRAEAGSFGYVNGAVRAGLKTGRWAQSLSGQVSHSDGYSRNAAGGLNSDFFFVKSFLSGVYSGNNLDVNYHAGLSMKDYGSNTFYSAKFDDQFEHTAKTFVALSAEGHGPMHLKGSVYWNHGEDRFELMRGDESKVPFNYHKTNVLGADVHSWFEWAWGRTAFGAGLRNEGVVSTNLGESLPAPDGKYVKGLNRTQYSAIVEHNVKYGNFTLSAGLSAMGVALAQKNHFGLYPGADASYRLADNWKIYGSYNSSYRMPTFTELYYSVGGYQADKNLKPERMQSFETGLKYAVNGLSAVASLYYHIGSDMIDWIKDTTLGDDALWTSVNHTKLISLGAEFGLRIDWPVLLGREAYWFRAFNVSYSHISQNKVLEAQYESMYALEYLKDNLVVQGDFHLWDRLFLNASWRFRNRNGYKPYNVTDLKLSWFASKYQIYVEANNIFNRTYYDFGYIPQPGIWVKAGVKWNIDY